jgi:DNA-binding GntR family transcriptional regulator
VPDFQRPPTAQAAVLAELRRRILTGTVPPGSPLRQEDLATSLGVSRVPVREALRILEAEGLVEYRAHRGYTASELDLADFEEIYRLRALVEDDLARRAVAAADPEHLAEVRAAHAALAALERTTEPNPAALAAANRAFHWAILRPGPRAARILAMLWDASDTYRARWFADPGNVERGADEHARIVAALAAQDADEVVGVLAAHREAAVRTLGGHLAQAGGRSDQ